MCAQQRKRRGGWRWRNPFAAKPVMGGTITPTRRTPADPITTDFPLFVAVLVLVIMGLIIMYSSSAFWGEFYHRDSLYFFKRQAVFAAVGFVAMLGIARGWRKYAEHVNPTGVLVFTWVLLIAVMFCRPVANVHRWIPLGPVRLQPSELAKISLIFFLARYLDANKSRIVKSYKALTYPILMTLITLGLIAMEPDLGTPSLLVLVSAAMLFVGGMSTRFLLGGLALAVPVVAYQLFKYEYRIKRLLVFLSPEQNISTSGYQLHQSFLAIGAGGWFGAGLGASKMKLLYLPEPHTDFIFAIMAEELGLLRVLCVVGLLCFVLYRGLRIARTATSLSNSMTALGITLMLAFQSFYNMSMATGLVPTKGIPLPFFSYGGSSLLFTLVMMGILLGISARPADKKLAGDRGLR